MNAEFEHLKQEVERQTTVFRACNPGALRGIRRTLIEAWLAEIGVLVQRLQRDVVQLTVADPPPVGMRQAWARFQQVFSALGPVSHAMRPNLTPDEEVKAATGALRSVASRLLFVLGFLVAQIVVAVGLLLFTLDQFSSIDLRTALTVDQVDGRRLVLAHADRIRTMLEVEQKTAAARPPSSTAGGTTPSNTSPAESHDEVPALRGEIEGLAAALDEMPLVARDKVTANSWLQAALSALDREPPDYASAMSALGQMSTALAVTTANAAPPLLTLVTLGSLLGMITITIHLNWKWRNRWDTVGFLPWYVTKLIGAPVLSMAAVALMSQFTFVTDLNEASGFSDLGLRDADPLLIFGMAIVTGLFSNRVFDWLKEATQGPAERRPANAAANNQQAAESNGAQPAN